MYHERIHCFNQCCGSDPFFSDPDPGDPKRPDPTGFGSYLDMFLMFSKINVVFFMAFFTKSKHLMTLKYKNNTIILTKLYFRQFYITGKLELHGSFCG